mgnify:CR=1 FL=1
MNPEYNRREEIYKVEAALENVKESFQEGVDNSTTFSIEEEEIFEEIINDDHLGTMD